MTRSYYTERGIAKPMLPVCLSVRLSVTLRYRGHLGSVNYRKDFARRIPKVAI